jgi:hypothetical protein
VGSKKKGEKQFDSNNFKNDRKDRFSLGAFEVEEEEEEEK